MKYTVLGTPSVRSLYCQKRDLIASVPTDCLLFEMYSLRSFSGPNAEKYEPEKLRIRTIFTQ